MATIHNTDCLKNQWGVKRVEKPPIMKRRKVNRDETDPAVDLAHVKRRLGYEGRLWHSEGVNDSEIGLPLTALADQEEWQLLSALPPKWIGDL